MWYKPDFLVSVFNLRVVVFNGQCGLYISDAQGGCCDWLGLE